MAAGSPTRRTSSGRPQVYVQDFPALKEKWLISANGGADPQWRADGAELFFIGPDHRLMAVPIKRGASFEPGIPTAALSNARHRSHRRADALPGHRRRTTLPREHGRAMRIAESPIQVVVNWQAAAGR